MQYPDGTFGCVAHHCTITKAACADRFRKTRTRYDTTACRDCELGATHAGIPIGKRAWRWKRVQPGDVIDGMRVLEVPRPYFYDGSWFIYCEKPGGVRDVVTIERLRWLKKLESTGHGKYGARSLLTIDDVTREVREWARYVPGGAEPSAVAARLNGGWSPRDAVNTPIGKWNPESGDRGQRAADTRTGRSGEAA